ncbi:MAG: hypothetical protein GY769_02965 [bacterium]|nr:hypothetical protein [bacterium]
MAEYPLDSYLEAFDRAAESATVREPLRDSRQEGRRRFLCAEELERLGKDSHPDLELACILVDTGSRRLTRTGSGR